MEEKIRLTQAVVVEGKYDKIKLSSLIEGTIIKTDGFQIYKDRQKIAMIKTIAEKQGIIILTDSDRAGFQIRNFIRSVAKDAKITNIYIPQVEGKEKRKKSPGAEGMLGVEGIDADTLRKLFRRFGIRESEEAEEDRRQITRLDFYEDGLTGGNGAARRRRALLAQLGLPSYLTTNSLLEIINLLMTYDEYRKFCEAN